MPFSRELYIERDDFLEDPPKKFFRLAPGREVRLRYAYFITCADVVKDEDGEVRNFAAPTTPKRAAASRRRPQGERHAALGLGAHALEAEVRLYDHLFKARIRTMWPERRGLAPT